MRKILSIIIVCFVIFTFSSCTNENKNVTRQTFALDTVINITTNKKDSEKINGALAELKAEGKLAEIFEKYELPYNAE